MPSRFLLTYAVTNILLNEIRDGFNKDHNLYYTDNNIQNRIQVPKILDGWSHTVRDFPCIVITSVPGANRRMGIGDVAAIPYFGLSGTEDQTVATTIYRKFFVSDVVPPGTMVNATYNGDPKTSPYEWNVPVKTQDIGGGVIKKYIELTGSAIGPNSTYPRANFSFISSTATAEQYGGFFDFRPELYIVTLKPIEREIVTDKLWSMLWFSKKREIMMKGIQILDVSYAGSTQEDYGADKLYIGRITVSCATEFRQLVYYLDTVEGITVYGEAVLPPTI